MKMWPAFAMLACLAAADGTWDTLRDSIARMGANGDASFDLTPYEKAEPDLQQRARQIGSLAPQVNAGSVGISGFRQQLKTFYASRDVAPQRVPLHENEFLLGGEMLIAPISDATGKRAVYLPEGLWTNLETNRAVAGPRSIQVETKALPVFARDGAIIPLDSSGGMALHYFPSGSGEFRIFESDMKEYSVVHATPARLDIESKKDRQYQWAIHNVARPGAVGPPEGKYREVTSPAAMPDGAWFYDSARKDLQVRMHVNAGERAVADLTPLP